jgi:3-methyladenine DNA glycosylase AlkD
MSFDLNRLRRYPSECLPGEEIEPQHSGNIQEMTMDEIKELANPLDIAVAILDQFEKEKNKAFMDLVITGSAKISKPPLEDIKKAWQKLTNATYPNERELSLLNTRIAKLKEQLAKELQKKKSERNQFEINHIQQSINTLTKWKLPNKNLTRTGF